MQYESRQATAIKSDGRAEPCRHARDPVSCKDDTSGVRGMSRAHDASGVRGMSRAHDASGVRDMSRAHDPSGVRDMSRAHDASGVRDPECANLSQLEPL